MDIQGLIEELLRHWELDEVTLKFSSEHVTRDAAQWAAAKRALAETMAVVQKVLDVEHDFGEGYEVTISLRQSEYGEGEGYLSLYEFEGTGLLEEEQPVEWIIRLPEFPADRERRYYAGPGTDTSGWRSWFAFIAYSSKEGPTLVVGRLRKEGGEFTKDFETHKLDPLRLGDRAWPELARLMKGEEPAGCR